MARFHRPANLSDFYNRELVPRLTPEMVYTDPAHHWQESSDRWRGGCPWHQSQSGTSFVVTTESLLWYCAGCNIGGGPLEYLWRLRGRTGTPQGRDFVDLLRELAQRAGVDFPDREMTEEEVQRAARWEARRAMLDCATRVLQEALWNTVGGEKARAYLQSRGFTEEDLYDLGIGYYENVDAVREALGAEGHNLNLAKEMGLLWPKLGGFAIIPWLDERGRPLTLYGRWRRKQPPLKKEHPGWQRDRERDFEAHRKLPIDERGEWEEPRVPKTIALPGENTKAAPLYFDRARKAGVKHLVIVEGVLDAAFLQRRGDPRVVACVASRLSHGQVETLARYRVETVTICLDPDQAGESGIGTCIKLLDEAGIQVFIAPQLPGMDPDEFTLNHGIEAWKEHVDRAIHGYRWKARTLAQTHKPGETWSDGALRALLDEAQAFARTAHDLARLEQFFWTELAEATGLSVAAVKGEVEVSDAGAELDPNALLAEVWETPPEKHPELLRNLARAVVHEDAITVDRWATKVKSYKLTTKTAFLELVRSLQQEKKKAEQSPRPQYTPREAGDGLPRIDAGNQDLREITDEAWVAITEANDPPFLFRRATLASRIERGDKKEPIIKPITEDRLRHELARIIDFYVVRERKGETYEAPALPPVHLVKNLLATPDMPLPVLTRIVEAPVFGPDGTLELEPGYHASSETYYAPKPGFVVPEVALEPTEAEIKRATALICDELLVDFPFISPAEMAHAVGLLLLPFVRAMIDGPTPLHLIEKPCPGSGASLLADCLTHPSLGHDIPTLTEGRDEDEWRKRLTSNLREGHQVIMIDNLTRRLDSGALAAAITASVWTDRLLGASEMVRVPVLCTWLATGNNPGLSSEITRRTVRIRIDPKRDRPWIRDGFKHPDLRAWMRAHRADLVWAALTLGRAWIAAGRPEHTKPLLGMFESWSRVIGGILQLTGISGFLTNLDEFYQETDTEGAMWRAFIQAWWESFEDKEVGVSDLWVIASSSDPPLELGDGTEKSQKIRFGKKLKFMRDRQFLFEEDDQELRLMLKAGGTKDRAQQWKLVRLIRAGDECLNKNERSQPSPHEEVVFGSHVHDSQNDPSKGLQAENIHPHSGHSADPAEALRARVLSLAAAHQYPSIELNGHQLKAGEQIWSGFCKRANADWLEAAETALKALPEDLWSHIYRETDGLEDDPDDL